MHLKDPESLKIQLVHSLVPITETDPDSLADYILALLKKDMPLGDLEKYCLHEVGDFLLPGQVEPFIRELFAYLKDQQDTTKMSAVRSGPEEKSKEGDVRHRATSLSSTSPKEHISHRRGSTDTNTLIVDRLPMEHCQERLLIDYFSKFGDLDRVSLDAESRRAEIKFINQEDAQAAVECPDAILGNRFIRIYFASKSKRRHPFERGPSLSKVRKPKQHLSLTRSQSKMVASSASSKEEKQQRLAHLLQMQRQKQELYEKYIAQQKEILGKLEQPGLSTEMKTSLKEAMVALDKSIQEIQQLSTSKAQDVGSAAGTSGKPEIKPGVGKFKLDNRPGSFIMAPVPAILRNDTESFRKILDSFGTCTNLKYDSTSNSALIEYQTKPQASKV
jgi:RNA recognition motif-containing protein